MTASTPTYSKLAPWWTPWGIALRLARTVRQPSDVIWLARIGWFIVFLPLALRRARLDDFLARLAADARPGAPTVAQATERVLRLRSPWLRVPGLRSRNTCYVRALTLYRFVDAGATEMTFNVGAEWFDKPGGVLRGHAWVTVGEDTLEPSLQPDEHLRLQRIELRPQRR